MGLFGELAGINEAPATSQKRRTLLPGECHPDASPAGIHRRLLVCHDEIAKARSIEQTEVPHPHTQAAASSALDLASSGACLHLSRKDVPTAIPLGNETRLGPPHRYTWQPATAEPGSGSGRVEGDWLRGVHRRTDSTRPKGATRWRPARRTPSETPRRPIRGVSLPAHGAARLAREGTRRVVEVEAPLAVKETQ